VMPCSQPDGSWPENIPWFIISQMTTKSPLSLGSNTN
jgi:hypothetical protein